MFIYHDKSASVTSALTYWPLVMPYGDTEHDQPSFYPNLLGANELTNPYPF